MCLFTANLVAACSPSLFYTAQVSTIEGTGVHWCVNMLCCHVAGQWHHRISLCVVE